MSPVLTGQCLTPPVQFGADHNDADNTYKADLSEPSWNLLQDVVGDGTTKVVTDSLASPARFYRVEAQ